MKRLTFLLALIACSALVVAGCGGDDDPTTEASETTAAAESSASGDSGSSGEEASGAEKTKPKVAVPSGPPPKKLAIKDLVEGSGPEAKPGDQVTVQYVGVGYKSKEEFDSSWSRNEPFAFQLGAGMVISGWDEGVAGMKVGGRRELTIPPGMAYGPAGSPPAIGPNETLIFVVDLLAVE